MENFKLLLAVNSKKIFPYFCEMYYYIALKRLKYEENMNGNKRTFFSDERFFSIFSVASKFYLFIRILLLRLYAIGTVESRKSGEKSVQVRF